MSAHIHTNTKQPVEYPTQKAKPQVAYPKTNNAALERYRHMYKCSITFALLLYMQVHHMSCWGFAATSIHFRLGKFLALIAPKNIEGHAKFFREKFGITFAIFWRYECQNVPKRKWINVCLASWNYIC
jgi:hypothetical protein